MRSEIEEVFMNEAIKIGLIGGIGGLVISFSINYFVVPVPADVFNHALVNGMSGLLSGFVAGFAGLTMYLKNQTVEQ
jgi:ABC-type lipoprotein release transport system permease subunit